MARALLVLWLAMLIGCRSDVVLGQLDGSSQPAELPSRIGPASRIPWGGGAWYVHGANLPWRVFGEDFGTLEGASSAAAQAEIQPALAEAASAGLHVVRWHMFTSAPIPVMRDASGVPTQFEPSVIEDLRAALALAEAAGVRLWVVIFYGTALEPLDVSDPARRDGLARALGELVRQAGDPFVLSVHGQAEAIDASREDRNAFLRAAAAALRSATGAWIAADTERADTLAELCRHGADIAGFREGGNAPDCAFCTSYAELVAAGVTCPVVVHTFYAMPDGSAADLFDTYYGAGYAGALPWSLWPERTTDDTPIDLAAAQAFSAAHTDLGPR